MRFSSRFALRAMLVVCLSTFLGVPEARACATCKCGDPTLTLMGEEVPFAGRIRASLEGRYQTEDIGVAGVNRIDIRELRLTFGLSYAPHERVVLGLQLPVVDRQVDRFNLEKIHTTSLGDTDLSARVLLYRDRAVAARHRAGVVGLLRFPTAIEQKSGGASVDFDAQPGAGALVPAAGAYYAFSADPFSLYASAVAHLPATEGFQDFEQGKAVVLALSAQWQPAPRVGLRLGLDARVSENDRFAGALDPDSGGFVMFLSPGATLEVIEDLLASAAVQISVVDELNGVHDENLAVLLALAYDF